MRIFTLLFGIIFFTSIAHSQDPTSSDRVRKAKVQFFSEKLELSPSESKAFWPVYNDYQNRKNRLANERRNLMRFYVDNSNNMTDNEISETLDRYIEIEKEESELLSQYNEKFKNILPEKKVIKIYIVEVQFRNYLLKQLELKVRE